MVSIFKYQIIYVFLVLYANFKKNDFDLEKLLELIMTIWCIHNNVWHTTNNGFDRDEKQVLPFIEFLQDVAQAVNKENFIKLTNDMLKNDGDIKLLPKKMFMVF